MAKREAKRDRRKKLEATATAAPPRAEGRPWLRGRPIFVPKRWVKFCAGILLLPVAWVLSSAFFHEFAHAALNKYFWATEEFWFFSLGVVLWLIAFFGLPRPLWVYVFGHELTHALWVWVMGGRVREFKVRPQGGYIVTNKTNTWIALSPYFFPLYSVLLVGLWAAVNAVLELEDFRRWLFAGLGATWAFHFSFTIWMIGKGQSDLESQGTFFSLVLIYVVNLLILSAMLLLACPDVTTMEFVQRLIYDAARFSGKIREITGWW